MEPNPPEKIRERSTVATVKPGKRAGKIHSWIQEKKWRFSEIGKKKVRAQRF